MKLLSAMKKYLESEPNGMKVQSTEMIEFAKSLTDDEKVAAKAELRSYGIQVED